VLISNDEEDVSNSRRLQQSELLVKQGLAIDIGQALWTIADRALQSASTTGCENYCLPNAVGVAAGSPASPELSHAGVEGHWTPRNEIVKRLDVQPDQIIPGSVTDLLRGTRRTSEVRCSISYCFVLVAVPRRKSGVLFLRGSVMTTVGKGVSFHPGPCAPPSVIAGPVSGECENR
jgi:hypothetical protein